MRYDKVSQAALPIFNEAGSSIASCITDVLTNLFVTWRSAKCTSLAFVRFECASGTPKDV